MSKHVVIIGGGIGGLGSAGLLAKKGYRVTLLEKNAQLGGRANVFSAEGFTFDMGPSWYLMPDIFEHYFTLMGERIEDHLTLTRLSPSYRVFFDNEAHDRVDLYSDFDRDARIFESFESGAADKLKTYLEKSKLQYEIALDGFMYKNYDSFRDFFTWDVMTRGTKLSIFSTMDRYVRRYFKDDRIQKLLEYQLVFLGSSPYNTPALYNIMSHIDFNMGVFYPQGGIYAIITALSTLATKHGAELRTNAPVKRIIVEGGQARGVELESGERIDADIVISNADRAHTELTLLDEHTRTLDERYWERRTLAPSAFIMYLGLDGTVDSLVHHNLFFSDDWRKNFSEIFDSPRLPEDPSLYVCVPSKTDPTVAPQGKEALFVLVPIASKLSLSEEDTEAYAERVYDIIEQKMGVTGIRDRIAYRRIYTVDDFTHDYNSYGGSGLGLAHTLMQTAVFRPNNVSPRVPNLYFVGAATNPGIGMPICLISAELAYKRIEGITSPHPLSSL